MAIDRRTANGKPVDKSSEKKKQLVVVVLAMALLGVIASQNMSGDDDATVTELPEPEMTQTPVAAELSVVASPLIAMPTVGQVFETTPLPSRTLEEILNETPLLVIKTEQVMDDPKIEAEPMIVRAVYGTGQKSTAIVGDQIVHAGDVLPDGRKLIGASPRGLKTRSRLPVSASGPTSLE